MVDSASISDEESRPIQGSEMNTDYYISRVRIPKYRAAMAQVVMVGSSLFALCK